MRVLGEGLTYSASSASCAAGNGSRVVLPPIWIGIDPGLSGAVAILTPQGAEVHDTPTTRLRRQEYLVGAMAELLRPYAGLPAHAVLEQVSTRPGESAQSGLCTGRGGGLWEAILATLRIPYELVPPAVWKRHFGLLKCDKDASRLRAQCLFPALVPELSRKRDDGRAEALLLADYCRVRRGDA